MTFVLIGLLSGIFQLGLFALLTQVTLGTQLSNAVALLASTVLNTAANRRWTFHLRGRSGVGRQQVQGLAIVLATWLISAGSLWLLGQVRPDAAGWLQTGVVGSATRVATTLKFLVMKHLVFAEKAVPLVKDISEGRTVLVR